MNAFCHFVCDADGLDYAHHFVIEMYGTRQVVSGALSVEDQHVDTVEAEQIGERGADWSVADNGDIIWVCWRAFSLHNPSLTIWLASEFAE